MPAYKITIETADLTRKEQLSYVWYDNKINILLDSEYFDRKLKDGSKEMLRDDILNTLNIDKGEKRPS